MSDQPSFTGHTRRRHTRRSVRVADRVSRGLITVGGVGTILAVTLIMVFLVWVVLPLFTTGAFSSPTTHSLAAGEQTARAVLVDEHLTAGAVVRRDGSILVVRLDSGDTVDTPSLAPDVAPTCFSLALAAGETAVGRSDGSVLLGTLRFQVDYLPPEESSVAPPALRPGARFSLAGGIVEKTPENQFRRLRLRAETGPPVSLPGAGALTHIDLVTTSTGSMLAAITEDRRLLVEEVRTRRNLLTGELKTVVSGGEVPLDAPAGKGRPDYLLLSDGGAFAHVLWKDGLLLRFVTRDPKSPRLAEKAILLPGRDAQVSAAAYMNGRTTLVIGDTLGRVRAWFPALPEQAATSDGFEMVNAHEFAGAGAAVTALGPSTRTRLFAAGCADGTIRVYHLTSATLVAQTDTGTGSPVDAVAISPRQDAVAACAAGRLFAFPLDAAHPDVSVRSLFLPVWYEGYTEARHVWQSTGGTDDFEPKLGLVPLVFGTLKATVYSLLFALPIALLAAVFASEFLKPRVKARVKPTIEVMASLPSVVLGFLSALVIAPFVESRLPAVLSSFVTLPFTLLLAARLWQMLPPTLTLRHARLRFPVIIACVPAGIGLGILAGPAVERRLFSGDLRMWLDGQRGGPFGGWLFLLLPVGVAVAIGLESRLLSGRRRDRSAGEDRARCARRDLVRFLLLALCSLLAAALLAGLVSSLGLDPRGSVVGTYVQRNALVVGFVMGFAIIPIIFTIAEDALSAVPEHLRAASLGAGATRWQTAVRVVVPTAMSGLFSAVMIGLGRAVGETMIVLMAAGNTPVLDINVFNGFRTLSANLAVELPEAVRDSTHYRVLFLAALTLFAMTFVVNTVAEAVRLRFRRKARAL